MSYEHGNGRINQLHQGPGSHIAAMGRTEYANDDGFWRLPLFPDSFLTLEKA